MDGKKATRKQIRLTEYDYSQNGYYFITACTSRPGNVLSVINQKVLSDFAVGANFVRPKLTDIGKIVDEEIVNLNNVYENVFVDRYIIMPDHIHMIIVINNHTPGRTQFAPTLSQIIKQFKGVVTKKLGCSIWQKGFYDRVIRTQSEYEYKCNYIEHNALKLYPKDKVNIYDN